MDERVHDYHRDEHSMLVVGLMFVVLFDEWLRSGMGISTHV
jgi:hypothetical protein